MHFTLVVFTPPPLALTHTHPHEHASIYVSHLPLHTFRLPRIVCRLSLARFQWFAGKLRLGAARCLPTRLVSAFSCFLSLFTAFSPTPSTKFSKFISKTNILQASFPLCLPPPFALCLFVCSECHCVCHWVCVCEVVCMCCSVASVANQFKSFAVAVSTERKWSTSSSRSFPSLVHAVSYAAKETQRSAACSTREIQQKLTKLASGSEGVKRKMSCENTQEKQLQLEYSQLNCQLDRQKCNVIFYYNIIY